MKEWRSSSILETRSNNFLNSINPNKATKQHSVFILQLNSRYFPQINKIGQEERENSSKSEEKTCDGV